MQNTIIKYKEGLSFNYLIIRWHGNGSGDGMGMACVLQHTHVASILSSWMSKELSMEVTKSISGNCGGSLGLSRRTWCNDRAPFSTRNQENRVTTMEPWSLGSAVKTGPAPRKAGSLYKVKKARIWAFPLGPPGTTAANWMFFMLLTSRADLEHHRACSLGVCANLFHQQ